MPNIDKALTLADVLLSISINTAVAAHRYNAAVALARHESRDLTDEELSHLERLAEDAKARALAARPDA